MEIRTLLCVNTSEVWRPPSHASSLGWRFCSASSPQEAFSYYAQQAPRVGLVLLSEDAAEAVEILFRQTCSTMIWVALALVLIVRGPGRLSSDALLAKRF